MNEISILKMKAYQMFSNKLSVTDMHVILYYSILHYVKKTAYS